MGFRSLEDFKAYQAARALKLEIYRLLKTYKAARDDWDFRDQIRDAAMSGESNLAEGFRRFTRGEFAHFSRIAHGSIEEVAVRVQDGVDREYFPDRDCAKARELAAEAGRLITGLLKSLGPPKPPPNRTLRPPPRRRNPNGPKNPMGG
jgi:four helix bundle protein